MVRVITGSVSTIKLTTWKEKSTSTPTTVATCMMRSVSTITVFQGGVLTNMDISPSVLALFVLHFNTLAQQLMHGCG